MIEDYGKQAQCSCNVSHDYDTLCYEPCSVVVTMVTTMGDFFGMLFSASTLWSQPCDFGGLETLHFWADIGPFPNVYKRITLRHY